MELHPELSAARAARQLAARTAADWRLPLDREALAVVVSELVTNAIRHGAQPMRMRFRRLPFGVRVEVEDARGGFDGRLPDPSSSSLGLRIVATLTRAWGVEPRQRGKVVWAELESASVPAG
jgi:two-component sensor histidine kinase